MLGQVQAQANSVVGAGELRCWTRCRCGRTPSQAQANSGACANSGVGELLGRRELGVWAANGQKEMKLWLGFSSPSFFFFFFLGDFFSV